MPLALLSACTTTSVAPLDEPRMGLLPKEARVFIAIPADGAYNSRTYAGSGQAVGNAFERVFLRQASFVVASLFP